MRRRSKQRQPSAGFVNPALRFGPAQDDTTSQEEAQPEGGEGEQTAAQDRPVPEHPAHPAATEDDATPHAPAVDERAGTSTSLLDEIVPPASRRSRATPAPAPAPPRAPAAPAARQQPAAPAARQQPTAPATGRTRHAAPDPPLPDLTAAGDGEGGDPIEGSLARTPIAPLLEHLAEQRFTGSLEIDHGDFQAHLEVRGGRLTAGRAPGTARRVGQRLAGDGQITHAQLARALDAQRETGERLGEHLVRTGMVPPEHLQQVLHEQTVDAVAVTLSWSEGTWTLQPGEPEGSATVDGDIAAVLRQAHRRLQDWVGARDAIGSLDHRVLFAPDRNARPRLEPAQWTVLMACDGHRTVAEVAEAVGFAAFETAEIIARLQRDRLVRLRAPAGAATVAGAAGVDEPRQPAAHQPLRARAHTEAWDRGEEPASDAATDATQADERPADTPAAEAATAAEAAELAPAAELSDIAALFHQLGVHEDASQAARDSD